ncbi:MAG: ECF transporter S component [Lachnospiraceae bacterium]|jgi:uncharacterized membrane protein
MAKSLSAPKKLAVAAMFTALTLLATSVIKIQTPTFGYIHIGDAFVLLSGFFLGPVIGGLAAGLGSALSDLLGGYPIWVPGTFVIKFATALVGALIFRALAAKAKTTKGRVAGTVLAGVVAEAVMVIGYYFYNVIIIGVTGSGFGEAGIGAAFMTSLSEIPFNLVQGAVGVVLATLLEPVFAKIARTDS